MENKYLKDKTHVEIKYKNQWKHESAVLNDEELKLFMDDLDTHFHVGECHCFIKLGNHRVPRNQIEMVTTEDAVHHYQMVEWMLKSSLDNINKK